jgi:metallo-beta-lactamase family protein
MVLFPGYQAAGTRGRSLQEGAERVRIHGVDVPVRARVVTLDGLSAHGDREDLLRWAGGFRRPPARTFLVHAEAAAATAFAETLRARMKWHVEVAREGAVAAV